MRETFVCELCGEEAPVSQRTIMDEQDLCDACLEQETIRCSDCEERIWRDDNAGDEDTPLCQSCFDRRYTTCEQCGRTIRSDDTYYLNDNDEDPLCYDCYSHSSTECAIQDYSYKPEPIFYGEGVRYFGVELEIDGGGESTSHAETILELANTN